MKNNRVTVLLPLYLSLAVAIGVFIGMRIDPFTKGHVPFFSFRIGHFNKLNEIINYVEQEYVDTINEKNVVETTITDLLKNLDPHSIYIPAEDLQGVNEPLEGNFEGIGIEFHMVDDTIMVLNSIQGGPSDLLGILAGDRIIKVEGKNVAGVGITTPEITQKLRGKEGTDVKITIFRRSMSKLLEFDIVRGKIPIYSIDAGYIVEDGIGYIKVSRFAETTYKEFMSKMDTLTKQGMKNLILDLRGNPGGYLNTASKMVNEFLPDDKIIVYTQGKARARREYKSTGKGSFETVKLVVLIDEGSASASEIMAGALQDWDRATLIGRRSYGKGLVQEQSTFPDGSAIRLTVARYYTPTGRCIQKPYNEGYENYYEDIGNRVAHGELETPDSTKFPDSLKYRTPSGKIVYGGGGIMPDIFIPADTSGNSQFLSDVANKSLLTDFVYRFVDQNRAMFDTYKSYISFDRDFTIGDALYARFVDFAIKGGASKDRAGIQVSSEYLRMEMKAFIARQILRNEGYYPVLNKSDKAVLKAVEFLKASHP